MKDYKIFLFLAVLFLLIGQASAGQYSVNGGIVQEDAIDVADMPIPTADLTSYVYNNSIYYFGGYLTTTSNYSNHTLRYIPSFDSWNELAAKPTAIWGMIGVGINDTVYVFAGDLTNKNEMYNITSNTWSTKNNTPANISKQGITGCAYNNNIYLFYGKFTYIYYPSNDTYQQLSNSSSSDTSTWGSCFSYGFGIYKIGGSVPDSSNLFYNVTTDTWSSKSAMPRAMYGMIRENPQYNGEFYLVMGQRDIGEFFDQVFVYSPINDTWRSMESMNHIRDGVAGGFVNGTLYVAGGRNVSTSPYGTKWNEKYLVNKPNNWTNVSLFNLVVDNATNNLILGGTENTTNIALNKNTFADLEFSSTYSSAKAVDGSTATSWMPPDDPALPTNWTIDLGDNYTLYNISAYQGHLANYLVNETTIYISNDNITYSRFWNRSFATKDSILKEIFSIQKIFVARYIRIQINGRKGLYGAGISEFKAYKLNVFSSGYGKAWYNSTPNNVSSIDVNGSNATNSNVSLQIIANGSSPSGYESPENTSLNASWTVTGFTDTDIYLWLFGNGTSTPQISNITFFDQIVSGMATESPFTHTIFGAWE